MAPNLRQRIHHAINQGTVELSRVWRRTRTRLPGQWHALLAWVRRRDVAEPVWRPWARMALLLGVCLAPILCLISPLGCGLHPEQTVRSAHTPIIRVRLMQGMDSIQLTASEPAHYRLPGDTIWRPLNLQANTPIGVRLVDGQWQIGNFHAGAGVMVIAPGHDGTVSVSAPNNSSNGAYRGQYRLLPVADGKFDVINDVDVDSYVAGVLARELKKDWHLETYRAMAIVARTYALYEQQNNTKHPEWDVFADTRSQVYGGIAAETDKSREAAASTSNVVVAYEQNGQAYLFKPYYSSCCGGVTQSAYDAFGDSWIPQLSDQNNHTCCNASPNFNWGPVVIRKDELTRRIRLWATRAGNRAEKNMAPLASIAIQQYNRFGRPTHFLMTDAKGAQYSLTGEELRWSVNCDAENDPHKTVAPTTLKSSFVKVITTPDEIRFVEGHGWGHGVGLCQWCSERHAEEGMRHEDIVLTAYPQSKLERAY